MQAMFHTTSCSFCRAAGTGDPDPGVVCFTEDVCALFLPNTKLAPFALAAVTGVAAGLLGEVEHLRSSQLGSGTAASARMALQHNSADIAEVKK